MREIAAARVRYGYRKIRVMLQREGFELSKKVVYRLYREEGLSLRYRPSRRRRMQATRPIHSQAIGPNVAWSLDFVADQLSRGKRFRALTVVDVFTRGAGCRGGAAASLARCRRRTRAIATESRSPRIASLR